MKISNSLKWTIFGLFGLLYLTGSTKWVLKTFFQVDQGMGPEALRAEIWVLRTHGTLSIAVLILLGYLLRSHVVPALKIPEKGRKSGLFLLTNISLLILSVPFLLYITDEKIKAGVELFHASLGLILAVPFLIHLLKKTVNRPD